MSHQIHDVISKDLQDLLTEFIKREENRYETFYPGKVVDVNDPERIGRVRVRVYGIFEDTIPNDDLPWAIMEPSFVGSTVGSFIVPPVDAIVNVRFSNGNIYEPIYCSKAIVKSKLPTNKDENYPKTLIFFETDRNESFQINTQTQETTYRTSTGAVVSTDGQGNLTIDTTGVTNTVTGGKVTVKAPSVEIANDLGALVTPNPLGGPFCALPLCVFSGVTQQGKLVTNTNIPAIPTV